MTCIVALEHEGTVWVGGDSAGIDGLSICNRADEKVFINENLIMGFCGSFRIGQLLRYSLEVPEQSVKQTDDMEYLVNDFVDAVRELLNEKGAAKKENELEEHESSFIVGFKGKIYVVEEDYQVGRPRENYAAVGCGAQIALGALYATRNSNMQPQDRLRVALEAAAEYSAGVRGPFAFLSL
jgi:ATP-dependent protease HslVU (ClpYQ) peptidase subunit